MLSSTAAAPIASSANRRETMMASTTTTSKTTESKSSSTKTETLSSGRRETLVPESHMATRLPYGSGGGTDGYGDGANHKVQRSSEDPFTFKNDPLYRTLFWNDYWTPRSKS
jgi:hypothetical protein